MKHRYFLFSGQKIKKNKIKKEKKVNKIDKKKEDEEMSCNLWLFGSFYPIFLFNNSNDDY